MSEPMKRVLPEAAHQAFTDDLIALLNKYAEPLTAVEMLALAAHLVGRMIALQDEENMTPIQAMDVVTRNIEQGNAEVVEAYGKR